MRLYITGTRGPRLRICSKTKKYFIYHDGNLMYALMYQGDPIGLSPDWWL